MLFFLSLADIYAVISFYLRERTAVESYLQQRRAKAQEVRGRNLAAFDSKGLRERLERRIRRGA